MAFDSTSEALFGIILIDSTALSIDRSWSKPATSQLRWVPGSQGEGFSSQQPRQSPGHESWPWDLRKAISPPEPQLSVCKVGMTTGLSEGRNESIPAKRLVSNTSGITHGHHILGQKSRSQPFIYRSAPGHTVADGKTSYVRSKMKFPPNLTLTLF